MLCVEVTMVVFPSDVEEGGEGGEGAVEGVGGVRQTPGAHLWGAEERGEAGGAAGGAETRWWPWNALNRLIRPLHQLSLPHLHHYFRHLRPHQHYHCLTQSHRSLSGGHCADWPHCHFHSELGTPTSSPPSSGSLRCYLRRGKMLH